MVAAADVVVPARAVAEQDAGVIAGRRLARLDIEAIGMQGRFAGDSEAARIRAQIVFAGPEPERPRRAPAARRRAFL